MELTAVLAWLTLTMVPLNVVVVLMLLSKSRQAPGLRVLRERFVVALVLTVVLAVFGVIFVNNDQEVPWLGVDATKLITRLAILALAVVPAAGWLVLYYRKPRKR